MRARDGSSVLVILTIVGCVAASVRAQEAGAAPTAPTPDAADEPSETSAPTEPDPAEAEARRLYDQAQAFFDAGNFSAALAEFERAHELMLGRPNAYLLLYNVGLCYERLFQYDRALAYYQRYLDEGGPDADGRADVEATMRALENLLGTVHIAVDVASASVWIDDQEVGTAPGDIRVPGGRHTLEVRAPGHLPARREFQVVSRGTTNVELVLDVIPTPSRGISPAFFWASVGMTAVGVVLCATFGGVALADRAAVDARSDPASPDHFLSTTGTQSEIRDYALASDLSLGGAALFGVTALVLAFLTDWGGAPDAAPASGVALRPTASGMELVF